MLSSTRQLVLNAASKQMQVASSLLTLPRYYATHWNPKFKALRKAKFVKPKLPDFNTILKSNTNETSEERRARFIKEGMSAPITFEYKPVTITSSSEVFDPYVPPEGDGKASYLSKGFASQAVESAKKSFAKKFRHSRVIKKYDDTFDETQFAEYAQQLYIEAHQHLMDRDGDKLSDFVTEHAYSKMWVNMKFKTLRWEWIETLEPPKVTHIITREMLSKSNIYGQITVRLHSKQKLAIYDRFGRLAFGDPEIARDVLEYVVFEKHLSNQYTQWRLHEKIEPEWAGKKAPVVRTYVQPKPFEVDDTIDEKGVSKFKKDESHLKDEPEPKQEQLSA